MHHTLIEVCISKINVIIIAMLACMVLAIPATWEKHAEKILGKRYYTS